MGRKARSRWRWRIALGIVLAAIPVSALGWWQAVHWAPPRTSFPVQGALVGASDGAVDFRALAATGASFAYLEASRGEGGRDPAFTRNLAAGKGSPLKIGALHAYDPCVPAERQAANFVVTVPRDPALLPPVVALARTPASCHDPVSEAALESELTTFLNQIERHAGAPAILAIAPAFQDETGIAARIDRPLWLQRDWLQPDYAGRPWTLWTANAALRSDAAPGPLRWVVAQP